MADVKIGGSVRRRLRKAAKKRADIAWRLRWKLRQRIAHLQQLENLAWRAAHPESAALEDKVNALFAERLFKSWDELALYGNYLEFTHVVAHPAVFRTIYEARND